MVYVVATNFSTVSLDSLDEEKNGYVAGDQCAIVRCWTHARSH